MKKFFVLLSLFILTSLSALSKDMQFVQISDLRYSQNNSDVLRKIINDVNKLPDTEFVIFTGDNISEAKPEILTDFIKELKALKKQYYIVIGEKDVNARKDLSKKQYVSILHKKIRRYKPTTPNYVFIKHDVLFIIADGSKDVIPDSLGFYKDGVLEWIDANLEVYSDKNAIIVQHFPLVAPYEKETYRTYKADKYLDMLKNHKNIKAVISGHYGVNKEQTQDEILHITTAPAPQYRIIDILNYETKNPEIWSVVKESK